MALTVGIFLIVLIAVIVFLVSRRDTGDKEVDQQKEIVVEEPPEIPTVPEEKPSYTVVTTPETRAIGAELPSAYAVVIDRETGEILAEKQSDVRISPASMTKILTLLVASDRKSVV